MVILYREKVKSRDKFGKLKATEERKNARFKLPIFLFDLLCYWEKKQKEDLLKIGFKQSAQQFLFPLQSELVNRISLFISIT